MNDQNVTTKPEQPAALCSGDLLACPFCGSHAEMDTQQGYRSMGGKLGSAVAIYCTACSAQISLCREDLPDFDPDEIIAMVKERWNRRRPPRPWSATDAENIECYEIGKQWKTNSSLATWFPLTAMRLRLLEAEVKECGNSAALIVKQSQEIERLKALVQANDGAKP